MISVTVARPEPTPFWSALFTDRRIPRAQRASFPILLSDDEIAWIPRVATAERFRVRAETREVAVLRAERA